MFGGIEIQHMVQEAKTKIVNMEGTWRLESTSVGLHPIQWFMLLIQEAGMTCMFPPYICLKCRRELITQESKSSIAYLQELKVYLVM
jgi:hypothetical protein